MYLEDIRKPMDLVKLRYRCIRTRSCERMAMTMEMLYLPISGLLLISTCEQRGADWADYLEKIGDF
jgi:hypothetical protein